MPHSTLAQMLIIVLLILVNARIFFLKQERVDTLVFLSPLCILLCVLYIVAWHADIFSIALLFLSIFSFCINIHSLSRLVQKLYIDHYSPVFIASSALAFFVSLALAVMLIIFSPIKIEAVKHSVQEKRIRLAGNFDLGFREANAFEKSSAELFVYEPLQKNVQPAVVVVIGDKRAESASYRPYMILLSEKGYRVLACDFYTDSKNTFSFSILNWRAIRKLAFLLNSIYSPNEFEEKKKSLEEDIVKECRSLLTIAKNQYGNDIKIFFVADGIAENAIANMHSNLEGLNQNLRNQELDAEYFFLSTVKEYLTKGFGLVEQTDPLLAKYLELKKDKTLVIPRYLSLLTVQKITAQKNEDTLVKNASEDITTEQSIQSPNTTQNAQLMQSVQSIQNIEEIFTNESD
ncbi:MAG: hypothetical protein IJR49_04595 [Treponema sp.]|nr:hypothetical protein [Treponema sp.]